MSPLQPMKLSSFSSNTYHSRVNGCPLQYQHRSLTQWIFHLWILFAFLVIAGSEYGEGKASVHLSTDEVLGTAEALGTAACSFPSHWIGNWFQSGVHHRIAISHNAINTKGKCMEVEGEKYLVYEPRSKCYKCLVFNEKHINVLQYKESYCIPERGSLPSICSTISGDANLYAMFRLDAEPIDCPFQGPFAFYYDRGNGECRYPESSLDSCTLTSRLLFNYQACPDVPKTESVEEELQCIAAWKEGSYRYFLGLVQYRHHGSSSYEERFRCYAYDMISGDGSSGVATSGNLRRGELLLNGNHNGHHHHHQYPQTLALGRNRPKSYQGVTMMNGVNSTGGTAHGGRPHSLTSAAEIMYRVVQSGDATCNGLSTMEGSRTMFLRKAPEPIREKCQFPSWVQTHAQWHSLDQSSNYEFDKEQFKIQNYSADQYVNANGPDSLALSGSCMEVLSDVPGHHAKLILHARSGCKIGYRCMVLFKRDADILEVQFGEWSRKHEEACDSDAYFDPYRQPYITLISSTPKSAQCPTLGKFSLRMSSDQRLRRNNHCTLEFNGTLRMGCSSLDSLQLEISSQCHDNNQLEHPTPTTHNREVTGYNCHGWWEEDGITYMVATLSTSPSRGKRHCFVIRDSSSIQSREWMRLREGVQLSHRHSNAAGQHVDGNSHDDTPSSSSAALFFFNNNNHAAVGRTLEISSFADSCRRNVVGEGEFAYNATQIGHCFASSSSPSVIIRGGSVNEYGGKRMSVIMVMIRGIMSWAKMMPQLGIMESLPWILPVAIAVGRMTL